MSNIYLFVVLLSYLLINFSYAFPLSREGFAPIEGDAALYYQIKGDGRAIIFVHGGPGLDHSYLLPQLGLFSINYKVIFFDQRGSGYSQPDYFDPARMNMAQFVDDLERLRKTIGEEKFVLVGHSWGGMLAMAYAIAYPEHLNALILLDSMPATSEGYTALDKAFKERFQPMKKELKIIEESTAFKQGNQQVFNQFQRIQAVQLMYQKDMIQKLTLNFSKNTAKNAIEIDALFTEKVFEKTFNMLPQLKKLQIPTLLIYGKEDPIPVWTAEQIANTIPQAQLILIPYCGHICFVEQEADVISAMNKFLSSGRVKF